MKKVLFATLAFLMVLSCAKEEPIPTFTLTFTSETGGSVNITGGVYQAGDTVTVSATPDNEYIFDKWSDGNTQNPRSITVSSNLSLTALFKKKQYDLEILINGGGTVEQEVLVQGTKNTYNSGTSIKLTAIAESGWSFVSWTGDIESNESEVTVDITSTKVITANFERKNYDLTINITGEGSVSEEVIVQPSVSSYAYETEVRLTANPSENWEFTGWSGDIESTENPLDVVVSEAINVTATFERINPLYLDENGVTIKSKDFGIPGEQWEFNGSTYTIVDETMLRNMVVDWQNQDLSLIVTTPVTNMEGLFFFGLYDQGNYQGDPLNNQNDQNYIMYEGLAETHFSDFNQDISTWDLTNTTNISLMFRYATSFNQDIGDWNTDNVTNMFMVFRSASSFNQNIENWNTSDVTNMSYMFSDATNFNQNIGSWDTSNVEEMIAMFRRTDEFDQDIGGWNTSKVTDMTTMFREALKFNQNIGSWDTSMVDSMSSMFQNASLFDQDLSEWCVFKIKINNGFETGSALTNSNLPIWGTCPGETDDDSDGVPNRFDECADSDLNYYIDDTGCVIPPLSCETAIQPGQWTVKMFDSYGDGWQTNISDGGPGLQLYLDSKDDLFREFRLCSAYVANGPDCTPQNAEGSTSFIMPENVNFVYWVFPGDLYGEISAEIYDPNGDLFFAIEPGTREMVIEIESCQ